MGLFGNRRNDDLAHVRAEQKWDYIVHLAPSPISPCRIASCLTVV